jgi:hypothetical protein
VSKNAIAFSSWRRKSRNSNVVSAYRGCFGGSTAGACSVVVVGIDQHVLHRLIGSAAVMAEQCAHLTALAERPDIALHVVPDGTNVGLWGAFDIAARDSTVTVRLETVEDMTSTARGLIGKVTVAFERILGAALPRIPSHELILKVAEERWKTQI